MYLILNFTNFMFKLVVFHVGNWTSKNMLNYITNKVSVQFVTWVNIIVKFELIEFKNSIKFLIYLYS